MNKHLVSSLWFAASLLAPAVALADDHDAQRGNAVAFVKDSVITAKVKTRLAADQWRSLTHVGVDTDLNGVVVLSGTTKDRPTADRAVALARETEGVVSVLDHIRIRKDD